MYGQPVVKRDTIFFVREATTRLSSARRADRPRDRDGSTDVERQILTVTEELLEGVTLSELSVNQICARAGIARGTFYFYFSSKFAVVAALLATVMDDVYVMMEPFVNRTADEHPADALAEGLAAGWEVWSAHRTLLRETCQHWAEVAQLREIWLEIIERFTAAIAHEIDSERASGLASDGVDSRMLAAILLWSTERCAYVAGLGVDHDLPNEQAIFESVLRLWLRAIYAEASEPERRLLSER